MSSKAQIACLRFAVACLFLSVIFASSAFSQTTVSGSVEGVWTKAGSPYTFGGSVSVAQGKTLTIEPGVQVFTSFYGMFISGSLVANGSATDSIRITGVIDTSRRGFTSGPITMYQGSVNSFKFCRFDKLGYNIPTENNSAMITYTPSCTVENSRFTNIFGSGIIIYGLSSAQASPVIINNEISATHLMIIGRLKDVPNMNMNGTGRIGLVNGMTSDVTLTGTNSYRVMSSLTVPAGTTLTVQPGAQLHFPTSATQIDVGGSFRAEGTEQDSIRFMGLITPGVPAVAGPIVFYESATNSAIRYCRFERMGHGNALEGNAVIVIRTPEATVQNSLFTDVVGSAISVENPLAVVKNNRTFTTQFDLIGRLDNVAAFDSNGSALKIGIWAGMTTDVTLRKENSYKFLKYITVPSGRTLTLNPGVEIRFSAGISQLEIAGTLKAEGTVQDTIRFTGVPAHVQTTLYTGPIIFTSTSVNNSLAYTVVSQIGYRTIGASSYSMTVRSASTTIRNSRIFAPDGSGIFLDSVAATVSNNVFTTAGPDVGLTAEHLPKVIGNGRLKIGIWGIGADPTFTNENQSYTMLRSVTVPQTSTLTINPGVTVLFPASSNLQVAGSLVAEGTETDSIRFTGTGLPVSGGPLSFLPLSFSNSLKYATFSNLGNGYAVVLGTPSCLLSNCSIIQPNGSGVFFSLPNPQLNTLRPQVINSRFVCRQYDIAMTTESLTRINSNGRLKIGLSAPYISNTRFTKEHDYTFLSGLTIPAGITYDVDPGGRLSFQPTSAVSVLGTLNAVGTEAENILLTCIRGRNPDDNIPTLNFQTGSASVLKNVRIDSFGLRRITIPNNYYPAINVAATNFSMENCTIRNFGNCDFQFENFYSPNISLVNTSLSNMDIDAILSVPAVKYFQQKQRPLRLAIRGSSSTGTDTLSASNELYRIISNVAVAAAATMVIEPGVRVEFQRTVNSDNFFVRGTLIAQGTREKPITFASKNFSETLRFNYSPIVLESTSKNSILSYINMDGFGANPSNGSNPTMVVRSSSCTISNISITNSRWIGLSLETTGATISNSCFFDNPLGAVNSISGSHQFVNCNFARNVSFAINNVSANTSDVITAVNCWWGRASGPSYFLTNPSGTGDAISDRVSFIPWATTAFECNMIVDAPAGPLPVKLVYFRGSADNGSAKLDWQTATEINVSHFVVERSTDGIAFVDAGTVQAKNTAANYSFVDPTLVSGQVYYRLKMVDKDAKFEYSNVVAMNSTSTQSLVIYPNPVHAVLNIQFISDRAEKVVVKIYDLQGKLRKNQNAVTRAGQTTLAINIADLNNGMYVVQIDGATSIRKRFTKQ